MDTTPFRQDVDRAALRSELGLPADAFVIGHVGRFVEEKNHAFLVQVVAEVARREPRTRLLLVGEGPLRPAVAQLVEQSGLAGRVVFAGLRSDVARLMLGAMDVFLFPSILEGLGLVLVEAQASGLPCIISSVVPSEADVVPSLVRRMDLAQPPSSWAAAVLEARNARLPGARTAALATVEGSRFNIQRSVHELEQVFAGVPRAMDGGG
ncbi:MAG: glycosyltransferase [Actinomycetota bacterium]|nr:glycosyltransferase [Actinomycetota bacterium]